MKPHCLAAAAILLGASAQAQITGQAPDTYSSPKQTSTQQLFDKAYQPYPRAYGGNQAPGLNDKAFKGLFTTTPRLLGGYELFPHLAIEGGYVDLYDRGFHRIDPGPPEDTPGALAVRSFSTHIAAKYTMPVTDSLDLYGKVGVAHSVLKGQDQRANDLAHASDPNTPKPVDTGMFVGAGAQYRVNDKTTLDAQYGRHGHAAEKWDKTTRTNATGVKASVKMGF